MPWREVDVGHAPTESGIYRFSNLSTARGTRGRYVVRYIGQAAVTKDYKGLKQRLVSSHEHYRRGDRIEIFVISNPKSKYRRVKPQSRRKSMTKLDYKERMEIHKQMTKNPRSCNRNSDLKKWRNNWIRAGSIPIRKW